MFAATSHLFISHWQRPSRLFLSMKFPGNKYWTQHYENTYIHTYIRLLKKKKDGKRFINTTRDSDPTFFFHVGSWASWVFLLTAAAVIFYCQKCVKKAKTQLELQLLITLVVLLLLLTSPHPTTVTSTNLPPLIFYLLLWSFSPPPLFSVLPITRSSFHLYFNHLILPQCFISYFYHCCFLALHLLYSLSLCVFSFVLFSIFILQVIPHPTTLVYFFLSTSPSPLLLI